MKHVQQNVLSALRGTLVLICSIGLGLLSSAVNCFVEGRVGLAFVAGTSDYFKGPVFLLLGAIFGPYLFLTYPFPLAHKIIYIGILSLVACLVFLGYRMRAKTLGKITIALGLFLWSLAGLMGLGTGT